MVYVQQVGLLQYTNIGLNLKSIQPTLNTLALKRKSDQSRY